MEKSATEFMVVPLQGDDLGVCKTSNYRLVQCCDGHVVFSYTWHGKAIMMHMAADKQGLRHFRRALEYFCNWVFNHYKPKMILGGIERDSVARVAEKCGFIHIANSDDTKIYMRINNG
mgnify:CR=1 FL=1